MTTKMTPNTGNRRAFLEDVYEVFRECRLNAYRPDGEGMLSGGKAASMSYLINRLRGTNRHTALRSNRMWVMPSDNGKAAWTLFRNAGLQVSNGLYNRYEDTAWRRCTMVYDDTR